MNILLKFAFCIMLLCTTLSCHKHEETIAPLGYTAGTDIEKLFNYNLEDIKVIEPVDASRGIEYAIRDKAKVTMSGTCFSLDNENYAIIEGIVNFSFIEIYDRGTMLITNKPTSANYEEDKEKNHANLWESKGIIYISAKKDKNNVLIGMECACGIEIPKNLTGESTHENNRELFQFYDIIGMKDLTWLYGHQNNNASEENYHINTRTFGWHTLLSPISTENQVNSLKTFERPLGLNDNNSRIFIAVENFKNALGTEHTMIPNGIKAHYILVVGNNENFKYAIKKSQTTTTNEKVIFKAEELKDATPNELKDIVNALP